MVTIFESKDQFGTPIKIGDCVVFGRARNGGNTGLEKAEIVSFTDSGNPRVFYRRYGSGETRVLTGNYAKAFDNLGKMEQ